MPRRYKYTNDCYPVKMDEIFDNTMWSDGSTAETPFAICWTCFLLTESLFMFHDKPGFNYTSLTGYFVYVAFVVNLKGHMPSLKN